MWPLLLGVTALALKVKFNVRSGDLYNAACTAPTQGPCASWPQRRRPSQSQICEMWPALVNPDGSLRLACATNEGELQGFTVSDASIQQAINGKVVDNFLEGILEKHEGKYFFMLTTEANYWQVYLPSDEKAPTEKVDKSQPDEVTLLTRLLLAGKFQDSVTSARQWYMNVIAAVQRVMKHTKVLGTDMELDPAYLTAAGDLRTQLEIEKSILDSLAASDTSTVVNALMNAHSDDAEMEQAIEQLAA